MSGLLTKRAWLGGVTLVALVGVAACGDDDDDTMSTGGKNGGGEAGAHAGTGGTPMSGGTSAGGKGGNAAAGKSGMTTGGNATAGTSIGGEPMTLGGEGGVGGSAGGAGDAGAGGEGGGAPTADDVLRTKFTGTSPLPAVPADPTNKYADVEAAATLGQRFFFDEQFSGAIAAGGDSDLGVAGDLHKVSCKSCHSGAALDDERSSPDNISKGTGLHSRNSPALVNSSFYKWTNWGGRFAAQWELPLVVLENGVIMNGTRLGVAHRVFDAYKADYEAVFGYQLPDEIGSSAARFPATGKPNAVTPGAWEGMTTDDQTVVNQILVNYSKALAAYTRKLVSREAPWDAFMAGNGSAITASAKNGAQVFIDKGCMECHSGSHFSDDSFHALGVPQTGPGVLATDDGRFKDTPGLVNSGFNINSKWSDKTDTHKLDEIPLPLPLPDSWKGLFRTPSLRGVSLSAPYMHSGQFATLSDVIDFYATGNATSLTAFTITPQEKADLIAFLETLNGNAVPNGLLTDTAAN
jgi:cytochrome c peroxidase